MSKICKLNKQVSNYDLTPKEVVLQSNIKGTGRAALIIQDKIINNNLTSKKFIKM